MGTFGERDGAMPRAVNPLLVIRLEDWVVDVLVPVGDVEGVAPGVVVQVHHAHAVAPVLISVRGEDDDQPVLLIIPEVLGRFQNRPFPAQSSGPEESPRAGELGGARHRGDVEVGRVINPGPVATRPHHEITVVVMMDYGSIDLVVILSFRIGEKSVEKI